MYRFVAFLWDNTNRQSDECANRLRASFVAPKSDWRCPMTTAGLSVYVPSDSGTLRTYPLLPKSGIALGRLFNWPSSGPALELTTIPESQANRILANPGAELRDKIWGAYIAFLHDSRERTTRVYRDPSGAIPCFTTTHQGVSVVFSEPQDVFSIGLPPFSVNWAFVRAYTLFEYMRTAATGLEQVSEILPGELLTVSGRHTRREFLWNPRTMIDSGSVDTPTAAIAELGDTVTSCVATWAGRYSRIGLELSGGLDSSIVACCMKDADPLPRVDALNLHTGRPEDNEKHFARLVAHLCNFELHEYTALPAAADIRQVTDLPILCRPHPYIVGRIGLQAMYQEFAERTGVNAFFTGQGGDHLFLQNPTMLVAADFARSHGWHRGIGEAIRNAATLTGKNNLSILGGILIHGLLRRPHVAYSDRMNAADSFLNSEAYSSIDEHDLVHPLLLANLDMPPEKLNHFAHTITMQTLYLPLRRSAATDHIHSLMSQPVIQACLRIPTYTLVAGGRDRAIARAAFASRLPPEIATRDSKADNTHYYNRMISRGHNFVRSLLLEGPLAKQGLIDRPKLQKYLTPEALVKGRHIMQISSLIGIAAWLQSCPGVSSRAAA